MQAPSDAVRSHRELLRYILQVKLSKQCHGADESGLREIKYICQSILSERLATLIYSNKQCCMHDLYAPSARAEQALPQMHLSRRI